MMGAEMSYYEIIFVKILIVMMFTGIFGGLYRAWRDKEPTFEWFLFPIFYGIIVPLATVVATGLLYALIFLFTG